MLVLPNHFDFFLHTIEGNGIKTAPFFNLLIQ